VLTRLLAQLATDESVITTVPGSIPGDELSIHVGMAGLGLVKNSLPATRNIWVVKPGRTCMNTKTCLAARIINKDRQVAPKRMPLGARLAVNTHNMGGHFVESVKDAQWSMFGFPIVNLISL